jgi:hypothetical protein
LVAWFVITFDFYWLYKAISMAVAVSMAFSRIRDVVGIDWSERLDGLVDVVAREAVLRERIAEIDRA